MSKKNLILVSSFLIFAVASIIVVGVGLYRDIKAGPVYVALYFENGDVYFGKERGNYLDDAWYLRKTDSGSAVDSIESIIWKPTGSVRINRNKIISVFTLKEDSPVVKAMTEKK